MIGDNLRDLLRSALKRLIVDEWDLAVLHTHERTITSHLNRLISNVGFAEQIRVDHDHGEHGSDSKRYSQTVRSHTAVATFVPDIVIHRRGTDDDNLLVLEAKRAQQHDQDDVAKVRTMLQDPYTYTLGMLLNLGISSRGTESFWNPSWC